MSVITEFTLPADAFALERTFEELSSLTIEVERLATHSREWIMPFLWATADDLDALEAAFADEPTVEEFRLVDADDGVAYCNVHWSEDVQVLVDEIVDRHGIMQEVEAVDGTWYFTLKFVDREALEEFQTYFRERGQSFELQRLYDGTAPKEREYDLTERQREVLVTALELGYFAVPRETQIEELADALDISTNAVSQRLRRASANLTRNTLTVAPPRGRSHPENGEE